MPKKLYAERDPEALEPFYGQHLAAMTAEDLYMKSDIAAELAFRDAEIATLRQRCGEMARAVPRPDHIDCNCPDCELWRVLDGSPSSGWISVEEVKVADLRDDMIGLRISHGVDVGTTWNAAITKCVALLEGLFPKLPDNEMAPKPGRIWINGGPASPPLAGEREGR